MKNIVNMTTGVKRKQRWKKSEQSYEVGRKKLAE